MKEYLTREMQLKDCGNGYDHYEVTEFGEGKDYPDQVLKVVREGRTGNFICSKCSETPDYFENTKCEHIAIVKTARRQKFPEFRLYFINDGRIGYYKNGKQVLLSEVSRVNK